MKKITSKNFFPVFALLSLLLVSVFVFSYSVQKPKNIENNKAASLPGDCDGVNGVNIVDYQLLSLTFGKSLGDTGYDGRCNFIDTDNTINVLDFQVLSNNFGRVGTTPTPGSAITVNSIADTYVSSSSSGSNYGSSDRAIASDYDSNIRTAFLKFDIANVGSINTAELRLTAALDRAVEKRLFKTSSSWSESTINYSNKPTIGTQQIGHLDRLGNSLSVGEVVSIPLNASSLVPDSSGKLTIAIDNAGSGNTFSFYTKESNNPPQLIINGGGTSPTYTITPTKPAGATNTPTTKPTNTPTQGATPTPGPTVPPYTGSGIGPISLSYKQGGIWLTPSEIAQIPTNNASWDSLVEWANMPMNIVNDITCTSGGNDGCDEERPTSRAMFARAIVGLRTGNTTMINQLKAELDRVDDAVDKVYASATDEKWAQRNIALISVAANTIDYRPTTLRNALQKITYVKKFDNNKTTQESGMQGLTNKAAWGRWSYLTVAYLLEDWAGVNAAVKAHAKSMGEANWGGTRNDHTFKLSGTGSEDNWQTLQPGGKNDPIAIMPAGTMYQDHGVGGLWLADQYRAGNGPTWPISYTNYIYEGMASYQAVSWAADHLGYKNVFQLGNYAMLRTMLFQYSTHDGKGSWPPDGNDTWQTASVMAWAKSMFGSTLPSNLKPESGANVPWPIPVDPGGAPGRGMGFMYATHYARLAL